MRNCAQRGPSLRERHLVRQELLRGSGEVRKALEAICVIGRSDNGPRTCLLGCEVLLTSGRRTFTQVELSPAGLGHLRRLGAGVTSGTLN